MRKQQSSLYDMFQPASDDTSKGYWTVVSRENASAYEGSLALGLTLVES